MRANKRLTHAIKGTHEKRPRRTHRVPVTATRTLYPKSVKTVADAGRLLVSGYNNKKIGSEVRKGRFKGYKIYGLSLEERATCPRSCSHYLDCYGNNMPFAKRISHQDPEALRRQLNREIHALCSPRRGKAQGVMIRLHVLGDFFSAEYVRFWRVMLLMYPNLALWGYTAHEYDSHIGATIDDELNKQFDGRAMIRFSNGGLATMSTVSIAKAEDCPKDAFVCPEQTGKVEACGACGACWEGTKNVAFIGH